MAVLLIDLTIIFFRRIGSFGCSADLSQLNLTKSKSAIEIWKFRARETFRSHRVESPSFPQGHVMTRWEQAGREKRSIPTHLLEKGLDS